MPKRSSKKKVTKDINVLAAQIVDEATAEPVKNPAAVALGRLGGLNSGTARAKKLREHDPSIDHNVPAISLHDFHRIKV